MTRYRNIGGALEVLSSLRFASVSFLFQSVVYFDIHASLMTWRLVQRCSRSKRALSLVACQICDGRKVKDVGGSSCDIFHLASYNSTRIEYRENDDCASEQMALQLLLVLG